jgi:hypothetical protein
MSLPILSLTVFIFSAKLTGSPCGTIYFDGYVRYTPRRIWTDGDTTKQLQSMLRDIFSDVYRIAWCYCIVHERHERHEQDPRLLSDIRFLFFVLFVLFVDKMPWHALDAGLIR